MKNYLTIGIMIALQSGKRYSAKELSEKFETSVKSIYRAIDVLLSAGMPIVSLQGKNGGYELIKECTLNSSFFTMQELGAFISFIKSNLKSYSKDFSIDDRISNLNKNLISDLKIKSQEFVVDTHLWGHNEKHNKIVSDFKKHISNKTKISIEYINQTNKLIETRIIHPYTLVYKTDSWYVYSYCETRKSFRLFKLTRIKKYTSINQNFELKNIDILSKPWNSDFKNNLEEIDIELICSSFYLNDITDWLGDNVNIKDYDNKNDLLLVKGKAYYSSGLIHKLMEFGNKIKIIKPDKLRSKLCTECLNIYNFYNEKSAIL